MTTLGDSLDKCEESGLWACFASELSDSSTLSSQSVNTVKSRIYEPNDVSIDCNTPNSSMLSCTGKV